MIFNSLLNLADKDTDGTYKFICKLFFETNTPLEKYDCDFIIKQLYIFKKMKNKNFSNFINLFRDNINLSNILIKLAPDNIYGCFTNNKRVFISTLDSTTLSLTIYYLNTFGYENVKN